MVLSILGVYLIVTLLLKKVFAKKPINNDAPMGIYKSTSMVDKIGEQDAIIVYNYLKSLKITVPTEFKKIEKDNSLLYFFEKYYTNFQMGVPYAANTMLDLFLKNCIAPGLETYGFVAKQGITTGGVIDNFVHYKITNKGFLLWAFVHNQPSVVFDIEKK